MSAAPFPHGRLDAALLRGRGLSGCTAAGLLVVDPDGGVIEGLPSEPLRPGETLRGRWRGTPGGRLRRIALLRAVYRAEGDAVEGEVETIAEAEADRHIATDFGVEVPDDAAPSAHLGAALVAWAVAVESEDAAGERHTTAAIIEVGLPAEPAIDPDPADWVFLAERGTDLRLGGALALRLETPIDLAAERITAARVELLIVRDFGPRPEELIAAVDLDAAALAARRPVEALLPIPADATPAYHGAGLSCTALLRLSLALAQRPDERRELPLEIAGRHRSTPPAA
jgi:hypothetical protein